MKKNAVMTLVVLFLSFVFTVQAQKPESNNFAKLEKPRLVHDSFSQFEDEIGVKYVKVTDKTENKIFWWQPFKIKAPTGDFFYDEITEFPQKLKIGKCYLVHYCVLHNIAYQFTEWDCDIFKKYKY